MNQIPPPPDGFVVQGAGSASPPPPPPGFELDDQQPKYSSPVGNVLRQNLGLPQLPVQSSQAGDILKSGGTGLREGVEGLLGLPGNINAAGANMIGWAYGKAGFSPEDQQAVSDWWRKNGPLHGPPTSDAIQKSTDNVIGTPYQPQTTPGQYARTISSFVPGAALGEGGLVGRLLTGAVAPGIGSEAAGQLTAGTAAEPYARMAGALVGGMAPSVIRRGITPFPSSPAREALAQTLGNEGVDLTAGQRTGNNFLRYAESELGGGAAQNMMENQGQQFTAAALSRAGVNADRATPDVIDHAFTRIGQQFDDLAARNTLIPDRQLLQDLNGAVTDYNAMVPPSSQAPIVGNLAADIANTIQQQGSIGGAAYQSLSSRLARAARGTQDPQLSIAMQGMRGALDDAMGRSIAANNPADAGAWQQARTQYRNMLVIEKAATGAGENAAAGLISPSALRNATVQQSRRAYARGEGDFADLARAGEGTMKPLPQSGTAPRAAVRGAFSTMGGIAGAASGGGVPGGVAGAFAGAAIPPLLGRAILSAPGRAYLGNQLAAGMRTNSPARAALIAALLGHQ